MKYPEFVDDKTYFSMNSSYSELDQAICLAENLKKIHELTTKHYDNFEVLIIEYLKTGLDIFEMEIGIVSKIDGDDYRVCDVLSPNNTIRPGDIFPLKDTYCREVHKTQQVLGFANVSAMPELKDHPVYINMKLESYLSAPIYKNLELYGTLNFTSTKIREHGFSEHERDLIALMANAIGSFLHLSEKEENINLINNRLKMLVGYVAHDLRNPIGNILLLSKLIHDSNNEDHSTMSDMITESSEEMLEMIHTILESSAMGTGKITLQKKPTPLHELIKKTIASNDLFLSEKSISLDLQLMPIECTIDARRMQQVISNLLSNAIKYCPKGSVIVIKIEYSGHECIAISFSNKVDLTKIARGPGNFHESDSVGFGLEIVREVLALHGTRLNIDKSQGFFVASFVLSLE